jgi:hypothetical protein
MEAKEDIETVTKGEFALLIGVSPGRVSQYLKEGRISPSAVDGDGRNARIRVEQAKADLRISLDVGQRFGNGIGTRLEPSVEQRRGHDQVIVSGIDQEIKEQKLEQIRRSNRNAAISDAIARGTLMKTEDARAAMSKIASGLLSEIEGKLPEIATELASKFKLPHRDVLHTLRSSFRTSRAHMAEEMSARASNLPRDIQVAIQADETPATLN